MDSPPRPSPKVKSKRRKKKEVIYDKSIDGPYLPPPWAMNPGMIRWLTTRLIWFWWLKMIKSLTRRCSCNAKAFQLNPYPFRLYREHESFRQSLVQCQQRATQGCKYICWITCVNAHLESHTARRLTIDSDIKENFREILSGHSEYNKEKEEFDKMREVILVSSKTVTVYILIPTMFLYTAQYVTAVSSPELLVCSLIAVHFCHCSHCPTWFWNICIYTLALHASFLQILSRSIPRSCRPPCQIMP